MKTIALSLITMLATAFMALPANAQRYNGRSYNKTNPVNRSGTAGGGRGEFGNFQNGKSSFPIRGGVQARYGTDHPYGSFPDVNPYTHNGDAPMWPSLNTQLE